MSTRERADDMLVVARRDLNVLHGMQRAPAIDQQLFSDAAFGFHVQQAVEKSLKAWLAARSIDFPFTHDIERLLQLLRSSGADVDIAEGMADFTSFALSIRYEPSPEEGSAIDRIAAIGQAQKIYDHVAAIVASTSP